MNTKPAPSRRPRLLPWEQIRRDLIASTARQGLDPYASDEVIEEAARIIVGGQRRRSRRRRSG